MHQDIKILGQSAVVVGAGLLGGWHELEHLACHNVALKHPVVVNGVRRASACVVSPWWLVHVGGVATGTMIVAFCAIVLVENLPWTWRQAAREALRSACRATVQLSRRRFARTWQHWLAGRTWTMWAETKPAAPILLLSAPAATSEAPDDEVEAMPAGVSLDHPVIAAMSNRELAAALGVGIRDVSYCRTEGSRRRAMPAKWAGKLAGIVAAAGQS